MKVETGNLVAGNYDIFCHQVNCKRVMGAGVAKQIRNKYPEVYQAYMKKTPTLGDVLPVFCSDGRICINMYAQDGYGRDKRYTDYQAFQKCLNGLVNFLATQRQDAIVAFPYNIGCGLAGGDWNIVEKLLENFSRKIRQNVVIVKFDPEGRNSMIDSFRGEYAFLSNMYDAPIKLGGVVYTCAEAAFQAVKLEDKSQRVQFAGLSGGAAKTLGRRVHLRKNWNDIRVDVMRWIVHEKFKQNPTLKRKLMNTSGDLIEGNTWNDKFWGVCNGQGQNWLGRILMAERDRLLEDEEREYILGMTDYINHCGGT